MTTLDEIIRAEIRDGGPMRFERFMELALYHPSLGYYTKAEAPLSIGRGGDFYTSVSVGPLFGRLLARQFWQMWLLLDRPRPFWIFEQGAHDGRLARDILEWCCSATPEFFEAVRYGIVHFGKEAVVPPLLENFSERVEIFSELGKIARLRAVGVFFSNELVDAFPVRAILFQERQWHERHVIVAGEALAWTSRPVDDPALEREIAGIGFLQHVPEGYATEINLRAGRWMRDVGGVLARGYILTIDYGYDTEDFYAPHRTDGTLTAYAHHRRQENVLAEPGSRDITAHVDFTALVRAGAQRGLQTLGFLDQQHFLTGIARNELGGATGPSVGLAQNLRAWNTLTHPEFLGARFHALIQGRSAPAEIDGLHFARGQTELQAVGPARL